MKLFLLTANTNTKPFDPWYDKMDEIAVIAKDENQARQTAAKNNELEDAEVWLNNQYTTCEEIKLIKNQVVCKSVMWA